MSDDLMNMDFDLKALKKAKKKSRALENEEVEKTLYLKEFNMDTLPPSDVSDSNGVKIVVIGKPGCFKPGTEVLMWDGSMKYVEDVKVGDVLMGDDNTPRNVLELYHGIDQMYEIVPIQGTSYTVNSKHALVLIGTGIRNKNKDKIIEISVEDYLKSGSVFKKYHKCFRSSGITCWEDKDINLDPYFLGVWLGDGTSSNVNITNIDEEIINYCEEYTSSLGLNWNKLVAKYRYSITSDNGNTNTILNELKKLNLINNKHIPQKYKISSEKTRLELLAGLLDTDGWYDKKNYGFDFIQKNEKLTDDVIFIARSLGFSAFKRPCTKSCMYKGEKRIGNYFRVFIHGNNLNKIPTKVLRKQAENKTKVKNHLISSFKIIPKGEGEFYGFSLDSNRRFLSTSFEVLRNTGKSTIIADIIASKSHIIPVAQVFSGTEDSNHFYQEKIPGVCIFNKLDLSAIEQFVVRQKAAKQYLENPWAMQIIDDCTDDPKIFKKPIFQSYYKNGRHWKMLHILSLQYGLDIPPAIRTNIDYTFILRESNLSNREKLHKNFASCIDSLSEFNQIMDAVTEDYTALVICNRVQSNKVEDCVFWYKADPNRLPRNWKFGHQTFWEHHHERADPNYRDPLSL
jgi:intein/homing endonuclease